MSHLKTYRTLKNKCRNSKNKLPKVQKTTTAPAKNNCHRIRQLKFIMLCVSSSIKQRSKQHKTTAIGTKNNCQPTKKQLPSLRNTRQLSSLHGTTSEKKKTTAKPPKNNCRDNKKQLPWIWAVGQLKFDLRSVSSSTKQLPRQQKTPAQAGQNNCQGNKKQLKNNCRGVGQLDSWILAYCVYRPAQNNSRSIKKQLPRQKKTTAHPSKNNCRTSKKQLSKCQKTAAEAAKNNCQRLGQLDSCNLTYCVYRSAQNNFQNIKKQLPRQIKTTAE